MRLPHQKRGTEEEDLKRNNLERLMEAGAKDMERRMEAGVEAAKISKRGMKEAA